MTAVDLFAPVATYRHPLYGMRLTYYRSGVVYMLSGFGLVLNSWRMSLEEVADWAKEHGYERCES